MSEHEDLEKKRELLERAANRTRERLIDTLASLDHKRHDLTDGGVKGIVHREVEEYKKPIAITAGSIILAVSGIVGWSVYRLATRKQRIREERWKALRRIWNHPERIARKDPPKGSLASELGRKVLVSALTFAALEMTKRGVRNALPAGEKQPVLTKVVVRTLPA
jgi:hypothetical protein